MSSLEYKKKRDASAVYSSLSNTPEVHSLLSTIEKLLGELKSHWNIDDQQLLELINSNKEPSFFIPLSIFSSRPLGILEAMSKYLHENLNLSYSQIAILLQRNQRTIWSSYMHAIKKNSNKFVPDYTSISIPFTIFQNRKHGTLEALVKYLHEEKKMSFRSIARSINRDDRTIWTVYSRVKKKS